jgi:hypothetical protein
MQKRVVGSAFQKVTVEDFNNLGEFTRDSLDTIVGKLLIPDIGFSGFQTVLSGPAEVTVGLGYLFDRGKVYFNDTQGGFRVDLLSRVPAATRKIVAITAWGTESDTQLEPRTFLTDAATRATVARETTTEHWRWANIGAVSGIEGPDPQQPAVPTDVIVIAWVTMSTTGVESILMNLEGMVPTLREADNRLNAFDIWRLVIGSIIDTLRSELLALAKRINGLATFNLVRQVAHDVANLKELSNLPDSYVSYGLDNFLTPAETDLAHVDQLSKIEEGVRFPPAAGFDMQLGLLNQFDETVMQDNFIVLPAWDAQSRVRNVGLMEEHSISQYQYSTHDMIQKFLSRTVTRYGPPFTVCTNSTQWWQWDKVDLVNWTYKRTPDETFDIVGALAPMGIQDGYGAGFVDVHSMIRLRQMWTDTITEPYWEWVTNHFSVSGSLIAQTFANAQDGWVTAIEIYLSRVAATGVIEMMICETVNGAPAFDKVIARTSLTVDQMKIQPAGEPTNPTRFTFHPTFLKRDRYAIVLVTAGNHYVWCLKDTNLVSGTLFKSTDGVWAEGDPKLDLAFEVFFCKFRRNMTWVNLNALTLQGGIAAIDINADCYAPPGTRLVYQVQKDGIWYSLDASSDPMAPFIGLPPLLPFRVVFVGTDSVQPALGVASNSRVTTWRPRSDYRHVSKTITLPGSLSTTDLQVDVRVEAWRGAPYHTFVAKLLVGPIGTETTVVLPTTTTTEPAPDDPFGNGGTAIIYHLGWTGLAATTHFRLRFEGTTDNVLTTYHLAQRFHIDPT